MTEGDVRQNGKGNTDPVVFDVFCMGKINLKLHFNYIKGLTKERNAEAAQVVMGPLEIRKRCLQFSIIIYIAQVIVDPGADIKINHPFRSGHLDAFILVDVDAPLFYFPFTGAGLVYNYSREKMNKARQPLPRRKGAVAPYRYKLKDGLPTSLS